MKKIFLFTVLIFIYFSISHHIMAHEKDRKSVIQNTALIIIDIQYFYFPGGTLPLYHPEDAAQNAQKLLLAFREKGKIVIHVRHNTDSG